MTLRKIASALVLGLVLSAAPSIAQAQDAPSDVGKPEKIKDIRRLLDVTGAGKLGMQVMGQMVVQFKAMLPKVPPKFWDDFMREANADELINLIIPIYDRHLSHDEIKQIIKFYETPAGRKLITAMPQITQESMEAGKQWGAQLGQKIQRRLKDQGYQ